MRRTIAFEARNPIIEMNTTPLIDVMLVLLVMLIMTIPPQTHAIKLDLPAGTPPKLRVNPDANLLTIDRTGTLRWNGAVIDGNDLRQELAATRQMMPSPELHLRPDADARHGDVDQLLAAIKREQISRFGFVGNEAYLNTF
jgi:biopolymer transport protein ExbD